MRKLPKATLHRVTVLEDGTEVRSPTVLHFDLCSYPEGRQGGLTPVAGKAYTDNLPFVGTVQGTIPIDPPRPAHRPSKDRETMAVYLADLLLEYLGRGIIERRSEIARRWRLGAKANKKDRTDYVKKYKINSDRRKAITDQIRGHIVFLGAPARNENTDGSVVLLLDSKGACQETPNGWRIQGAGWFWQAWKKEAQYGMCSVIDGESGLIVLLK